ncbi:MAG: hypothetical protein HQM12_17580 [SAR324 cluster bacterium]|nr:hypothetical protein [SAR324 cluster bacterium]
MLPEKKSPHISSALVPEAIIFRTKGMMLRNLARRIYQLLTAYPTPDGNNFHRTITITENKHPQYTLDRLYKYLHNLYFFSSEEQENSENRLIEEHGQLYLRSKTDLWNALKLIGISPDFYEIPLHLREYASIQMLEGLVKAIPESGILYKDRANTSQHFRVSIQTDSFYGKHPDGSVMPEYIHCIKIHRISWHKMRSIKIWELIPKQWTRPTPVCLIHGFMSNYYSFHLEGNTSMDYELVRSGSRVFVLDHIRMDNNANLDVFAEYLVTSIVDFAREITGSSQVMLAGHSMGGILSIIQTILDTIRQPRFFTAVKALMIINSPLTMKRGYWMPGNVLNYMLLPLSLLSRDGTLPFKELSRLAKFIPFIEYLATADISPTIKRLSRLMGLNSDTVLGQFNTWHERLNPISISPQILKTSMEHAITNPPEPLLRHFAKIVENEIGVTSYNYELTSGLVDQDFSPEEKKMMEMKTRYAHINYTENYYRIPATIPLLEIHNTNDPLANPDQFNSVWNLWPQLHKLKISHTPSDELDERRCIDRMNEWFNEHGLSCVIGLHVTEGRHMDSLVTEKGIINAFVDKIEQCSCTLADKIRHDIEAHVKFRNYETRPEIKFIAERDFSKKIRFLEQSLLNEQEQKQVIDMMIELISTYEPHAKVGESFHNFMIRNPSMEQNKEIQYNVLYTSVRKILSMAKDPLELMHKINNKVISSDPVPVPECFRSLIDLSLGLFDQIRKRSHAGHMEFRPVFENFLNFSFEQPQKVVSLHAFRAYLHTRDPEFIKKGGELLMNIKQEWQDRAHQVFREEIEHQLNELKYASIPTFTKNIKPLMDVYRQLEERVLDQTVDYSSIMK